MKIGLVYSGGLAKGAYQVGFTKALLENIDVKDVCAVSASSIGMVAAYALASENNARAEAIWRETDLKNGVQSLYNICLGKLLDRKIDLLMSPNDRLICPLYLNVCYFPLKVRYYKLQGAFANGWKKLMRAGLGFPVLTGFPSVFDRKLAYDGGTVDNIPLYPLIKNESADLIVVMHFDAFYSAKLEFGETAASVIDFDLSYDNNFIKSSYDLRGDSIGKMIDSGYEYGRYICGRVFASGSRDVAGAVEEGKKIMSEERRQRERSPAVDTLFSAVNRLGKAFRSGDRCILDYRTKKPIGTDGNKKY